MIPGGRHTGSHADREDVTNDAATLLQAHPCNPQFGGVDPAVTLMSGPYSYAGEDPVDGTIPSGPSSISNWDPYLGKVALAVCCDPN